MVLPEWASKFREPKTEIKRIKGAYYKYAVQYNYNPAKKRTDKKTGSLLGKITPEGFLPSAKNTLRTQPKKDAQGTSLIHPIDIKTFGVYRLFATLLKEEFEALKNFFSETTSELLFAFALFRWAYNTPIKRAPYYYTHDFCSEQFATKVVSDMAFSDALKLVGERRTQVAAWMKTLLGTGSAGEFVMMDSTHVFSSSEHLGINAKGYNPDFIFEQQVRLMYLFSARMQKPVYYRLIGGEVTDLKSMALCVAEMGVSHVIYIADKGFYSKDNAARMQQQKLQYIIPLQRANKLIDYDPLQQAGFKEKLSYFTYRQRIIWYYRYEREGQRLITFLDEGLRAKEESDYVARIRSHPEQYTKEKFSEKLPRFGTLTITYHIAAEKSGAEIYEAYKQRNEIEVVFDAYKNFLKADLMYMQNRYVLEGWLLANFLAMLAYHKLYARLREQDKLEKYAPKDVIELSKSVYKVKINGKWALSEITRKKQTLFKALEIDYLT